MQAPAQTRKSLLPSVVLAHSSHSEKGASILVESRVGERIRSYPDVEERSCFHFQVSAQSFPPALSDEATAVRKGYLETTSRSIGVLVVH